MPYEPGSYLKELEAAHHNDEHAEDEDSNCPVCSPEDDLLGFESSEEMNAATHEVAHELEDVLAAHARGEHRERPGEFCIHQECLNRE